MSSRGRGLTVFVEGGGDRNPRLASECRRAFSKLFESAGLGGRRPSVIVCGGRAIAYRKFRESQEQGGAAVLLVDSEGPVGDPADSSPWEYVRTREGDGWEMPDSTGDGHLHFMVQVMETWFLADRDAMRRFWGEGFQENKLPATSDIERLGKDELYKVLDSATARSRRGPYKKGAHSFHVLATLDVGRIRQASPWADRFFRTLDTLTQSQDR